MTRPHQYSSEKSHPAALLSKHHLILHNAISNPPAAKASTGRLNQSPQQYQPHHPFPEHRKTTEARDRVLTVQEAQNQPKWHQDGL